MAVKALVVYDDFQGGDWGTLGSKRAAKNQFAATNVIVYGDGSFGPRCGARSYVNGSGMATSDMANSTSGKFMVGTVQYAWAARSDASTGTTVSYAPTNASTWAPTATGETLPTVLTQTGQAIDNSNDTESFFIANEGVCKYVHTGTSPGNNLVTLIAGSPGGVALTVYGERMITGGHLGSLQRLFFSAPADFLTWPALNFIDVGLSPIVALYVIRGLLVILKADYGVWVLTGVPGVNETLREVVPGVDGEARAFHHASGSTDRLTQLWSVYPSLVSQALFSPAVFAGAGIREFERYRLDAGSSSWGSGGGGCNSGGALSGDGSPTAPVASAVVTAALHEPDSVLFAASASSSLLLRHNDVWTKHSSSVDAIGMSSVCKLMHLGRGRVWAASYGNQSIGNVFSWQAQWDQVPIHGTGPYNMISVGDGPAVSNTVPVAANLTLSEFWQPDNKEMIVRTVLVDVTCYDIGVSLTSRFTLELIGIGRHDGADEVAAAQTWDSGSIIGGATGTHRTVRLSFAPMTCRAFQLSFHSIRGLGIRRITVLGEEDAIRG